MMSDDQILEVVQAHKEGKQIQAKPHGLPETEWYDCRPIWEFNKNDYRVAPEPRKPREWRMPVAMIESADMIKNVIHSNDEPTILVREVIE